VQQALEGLEGVLTVRVSLDLWTAEVIYDPARVTIEKMIGAMDNKGYTARVVKPEGEDSAPKSRKNNCGIGNAFC